MNTNTARWGERNSSSTFSDTDNVLLQITLAFTIILGYLLSEGLAMQAVQSTRLKERDQAIAKHKGALEKLENTSLGEFAVSEAEKAEEIQKLKLLHAWDRLKPQRLLRHRLYELQNVDRIRLAADRRFVPDDRSYTELLNEAARVFHAAPAPHTVNPDEVTRLLIEVWNLAGFDNSQQQQAVAEATRRAFSPQFSADEDDLVEKLNFDPKVPSMKNLGYVATVIRQDLEDERSQLAPLQFRLVKMIAIARLGGEFEPENITGPEALRAFVTELKDVLGLLPEVQQQLLNES